MQSVSITTNVLCFESRSCRGVLNTKLCDKFVIDFLESVFFSDTVASYTNKTDRHDIAEIFYRVAKNTLEGWKFEVIVIK
jgi:hypothetical protein